MLCLQRFDITLILCEVYYITLDYNEFHTIL